MEQTITRGEKMLSPEDSTGIERVVLDYVEGWYKADPARMERALHPDLVKRSIRLERRKNKWVLGRPSTAAMMVQSTELGGGSEVPPAEREYEIIIQDVFRHMAVVKAISPQYVDYCQLLQLEEVFLHGRLDPPRSYSLHKPRMSSVKLPLIDEQSRATLFAEYHRAAELRLGRRDCLYGHRPSFVESDNPEFLIITLPRLVIGCPDTYRTP